MVAQASTANNVGSTDSSQTTANAATDAFGLSFESLLKIVLTQLTYQDPLKPMDNFQFVSQLAQFSQIQQGQVAAEKLSQLVAAQSATQATNLLGKTVDIAGSDNITLSGQVTALSLQDDVRLTIKTPGGQTISGLPYSSIVQVREGN
jgi:Flagellar hook capping protein